MAHLYHASTVIVKTPRLIVPNHTLDFGAGFYTTANIAQAAEFARIVMMRRRETVQFVNVYDFDMEQAVQMLSILRFNEPDESWLDFVCHNRQDKYAGKQYDVVIGAVANDKVYSTIGLYESGLITKNQAIDSFKINPLYDQVVFKSETALSMLEFREAFDPRRRAP